MESDIPITLGQLEEAIREQARVEANAFIIRIKHDLVKAGSPPGHTKMGATLTPADGMAVDSALQNYLVKQLYPVYEYQAIQRFLANYNSDTNITVKK